MIACCGNDCGVCPRLIATKDGSDLILGYIAGLWQRCGYRGTVVSADDIRCTGCSPELSCRYGVAACAAERGMHSCGECDDYPCSKIEEAFSRSEAFVPGMKAACSKEEYDQLDRAFLHKRENLERQKNKK